jgi:hypothetical protein
VPDRGLGFAAPTWGPPKTARACALPAPRITFNYLGQVDATFNDQALLRRPPRARATSAAPRRCWATG